MLIKPQNYNKIAAFLRQQEINPSGVLADPWPDESGYWKHVPYSKGKGSNDWSELPREHVAWPKGFDYEGFVKVCES